jgi:hypothetical protein
MCFGENVPVRIRFGPYLQPGSRINIRNVPGTVFHLTQWLILEYCSLEFLVQEVSENLTDTGTCFWWLEHI